jgi:hypothetical protein
VAKFTLVLDNACFDANLEKLGQLLNFTNAGSDHPIKPRLIEPPDAARARCGTDTAAFEVLKEMNALDNEVGQRLHVQ